MSIVYHCLDVVYDCLRLSGSKQTMNKTGKRPKTLLTEPRKAYILKHLTS